MRVSPFLLKLSFEEESLDFHSDTCLFLRGQLFKHFHEAHEVVFIAVLWFFNVRLYSFVTFREVWLRCPLHRPHSVVFTRVGADGSHWLAAARFLAVVWIRDDGYLDTVIIIIIFTLLREHTCWVHWQALLHNQSQWLSFKVVYCTICDRWRLKLTKSENWPVLAVNSIQSVENIFNKNDSSKRVFLQISLRNKKRLLLNSCTWRLQIQDVVRSITPYHTQLLIKKNYLESYSLQRCCWHNKFQAIITRSESQNVTFFCTRVSWL